MSSKYDIPVAGQPFNPSASAWGMFVQTSRAFQAQTPYESGDESRFFETIWYHGKLASSLAAGSMSSPTTCTVNIWLKNESSGASPKPLVIATASWMLGLTVENYDPSTFGSTGYYCKIHQDYLGVWSFLYVGCSL